MCAGPTDAPARLDPYLASGRALFGGRIEEGSRNAGWILI
jgi:hypothetical protein